MSGVDYIFLNIISDPNVPNSLCVLDLELEVLLRPAHRVQLVLHLLNLRPQLRDGLLLRLDLPPQVVDLVLQHEPVLLQLHATAFLMVRSLLSITMILLCCKVQCIPLVSSTDGRSPMIKG